MKISRTDASQAIDPEGKKSAPATHLLSQSSILILSGFLIGMASSHPGEAQWAGLAQLAGVCGLVSYFGLGYVARQRAARKATITGQMVSHKLECRIDRINALKPTARTRSPLKTGHRSDQQYVTVSRSGGITPAPKSLR